MLELIDVAASIEGNPILQGVSLKIAPGEIHAIMGPNGAGKSTLARVLAGHPSYEVSRGEIWFCGQNLQELEPEERAHLGLFMSFQYPVEVPGVNHVVFLRHAVNAQRKARGESEFSPAEFEELLEKKMRQMEVKPEFRSRNVNENFSGGEKKRNEILQMALLSPRLAVLDETDSGLDIDSMKIVARGVNQLMAENPKMGLLLITHYQRLLDYIPPHFVHILHQGRIVQSGGAALAIELESRGYEPFLPSAREG